MVIFCPRCGAPLPTKFLGEWFRTNEQCSDCGVALLDAQPMLSPSDDEVEYGLDEWLPGDRAAVTAALADLDTPYRWEPGLVLVVPGAAETDVDRFLDDLEAADEADDPVPDDGDGFDEEDGDGGEEAQEAMANLFVAADRLQRAPWDKAMAADLSRAAAAVGASLPPYGIDGPAWGRIQGLASVAALSGSEEVTDDELVASDARALRDFLRDYV